MRPAAWRAGGNVFRMECVFVWTTRSSSYTANAKKTVRWGGGEGHSSYSMRSNHSFCYFDLRPIQPLTTGPLVKNLAWMGRMRSFFALMIGLVAGGEVFMILFGPKLHLLYWKNKSNLPPRQKMTIKKTGLNKIPHFSFAGPHQQWTQPFNFCILPQFHRLFRLDALHSALLTLEASDLSKDSPWSQ